jgi:hypothetical protein
MYVSIRTILPLCEQYVCRSRRGFKSRTEDDIGSALSLPLNVALIDTASRWRNERDQDRRNNAPVIPTDHPTLPRAGTGRTKRSPKIPSPVIGMRLGIDYDFTEDKRNHDNLTPLSILPSLQGQNYLTCKCI